jgi:hypothetical protein
MKKLFGNLVSNFGKMQKVSAVSSSPKTNNTAGDLTGLTKSLSGLPTHVVEGVNEVVNNITDYLKVAEQEKTKRTDITAKRDVALASIRSQRKMFSELMQYTFQERAAAIQKQFEILDLAMEKGDASIIGTTLNSMVSVIQSSPFKNVQEMQQALGNKDFVIRLE